MTFWNRISQKGALRRCNCQYRKLNGIVSGQTYDRGEHIWFSKQKSYNSQLVSRCKIISQDELNMGLCLARKVEQNNP